MPTLPERAAAMAIVWGEFGLALHSREISHACEGRRGGRAAWKEGAPRYAAREDGGLGPADGGRQKADGSSGSDWTGEETGGFSPTRSDLCEHRRCSFKE
jgi:hypothetical protein